jgi:dynamin 1-like protein
MSIDYDKDFKKIHLIQSLSASHPDLQFSLPQIVVIGPQSCGKSSILEQIIQKDILPRGNNLVTRCPIIINLHSTKGEEYVEFPDGEIIHDFSQVKKRIKSRMKKVCGKNQGIVDTEIIIFIYLKNIFSLTLVDLPGLTKIPKGDQPHDIEDQIEKLIYKYTSGENSFILAIINANVDIVNSEALKMASKVDSEGKRTLGVVTKIDIMDEGTDY